MSTEPVATLVTNIAGCKKLSDPTWTEYALVIGLATDGWLDDMFGYAFHQAETPLAFTPDYDDVEDPAGEYLKELYPDGNYPVRMLVQFNRHSGRYNVEFEDTDTTRWQITPANLEQAREALRPNLD